MKNLVIKIAMGHLKSPEYKGDLLEFNKEKQEEENNKKALYLSVIKTAKGWMETLEAVKKTINHFMGHTDFNVERRGGNFYFHPKKEVFKENKSYPMMFVLPNGDTFISDASHKEREHEENTSKLRTPQHQPPLGAKKYTMSGGIKAMIDILSNEEVKSRYH